MRLHTQGEGRTEVDEKSKLNSLRYFPILTVSHPYIYVRNPYRTETLKMQLFRL
jgi:hypothetical protein